MTRSTAALTAVVGCAAAANATSLLDFNLVTFGDATLSADVQGAVAVGGNLSVPSVGAGLPSGHAGPVLVVGGNINTSSDIHILGSGGVVVRAGQEGKIDHQRTGSVSGASAAELSGFFGDLQQQAISISAALKDMAPTAAVNSSGNAVFDVGDPTDGLAVFTFADPDDLFRMNLNASFSDLDADETVVINVGGGTVDIGSAYNVQFAGTDSDEWSRIIFNFYEATSLTIRSTIQGAILAPYADVNLHSNTYGSLFAASLESTVQVHVPQFTGELPPPTSIPTPAAFGAGSLGLGLLAARRRRA